MSDSTTTTTLAKSEQEVEAEKAQAKLNEVAQNLGERIWNRSIMTEAGLSMALLVNKEKAGVNEVGTLCKAIATWIRAEHGDQVDTLHYTEAMKSILRS